MQHPKNTLQAATLAEEVVAFGDTPFGRFLNQYASSKVAVVAAVMLFFLIVVAIIAPWIAPQNPYDLAALNIFDARMPPGSLSTDGTQHYVFGTDEQGRDMLSAMIYGLRISIGIGISATLFALIIGMTVGMVAGFAGGKVESFLMRLVDIQLSFPAILVALILIAVLKPGLGNIVIALVAVQWAYYARTTRSVAIVERRKEYMEAARGLGLSPARMVFKHLLPNCLPPLIVVAALQVASAIALEATLSFLGLGVPVTEPSLGMLIANGQQFLLSGKYWISVYPGLVLLTTVMVINLVADQLRDVLNPKLQKQ